MKKIILFFLFLIQLFSITTTELAKISANALYNLDKDQIKITLQSFLLDDKTIKSLEIIDYTDNSVFFQVSKDNNKLNYNKFIENKNLFKKEIADIIKDDEVIGQIIVYRQNNSILNEKEKKWVENNVVRVGVEQWIPVVFSNNGNDIDGIAGDFTKLIIKKTGLKIKVVNDKWNPLLENFKYHKIDILPATFYTKQRAKYGLYSKPYFKMQNYLYVRDDSKIKSFKDIKTLAIIKGYGTIPKIKAKFPHIKIIQTKDLLDSINRVLEKKADALYDGQTVVTQVITQNLITGLKSIPQHLFPADNLHYFINSDKPILLSIIQKGLNSITLQERGKILSKWLSDPNANIELTNKEKVWLSQYNEIKYTYDPDWKPIEWADDIKQPEGILKDVLNLIIQRTNLNIKMVYSKSWSDVLHKIKTNQADAYSTSKNDNPNLNFTKHSILKVPYVFVTRIDENYIEDINTAKNKKIGVFKDSSIYGLLKKDYPNLKLVLFKSDKDGFKMLEDGKIDIAIFNFITAKYYLNLLGLNKVLKINDKTKYTLDLKIAVNKKLGDIPISIIDKGIATITKKEMSDIIDKWTNVKVKKETNWKLIIQIVGILILIVILMIFYNYKLNKKVKEKTLELRSLLDSFDKNVIASKTDKDGVITYVSEAFCEISGYSKDELIGQYHSIVIAPNIREELFHQIRKQVLNHKTWRGEIKQIKKNGEVYWVEAVVTPEYDLHNNLVGISSIRHDITAKKAVEELSQNLEKIVDERTKELAIQKAYLESFFENRGVGILIVDKDRTNIKVNQKLCELWGYEENELIGKNASILHVSKESYIEFGKTAFSQVKENKKVEIEYQFKKKNNELFWAKFYGEFIGDGNILWVIEDITKEKEIKNKLESEKKLISSIINSQDSIVITSDGKRLTTANDAFRKFYNVQTIEEFVEKYGPCICDSFEKDVSDEYLQKDMNGISWIDYILTHQNEKFKVVIKKDNKPHIFTISLDSFEFESQKFITVVLNDITELEEAQHNIEILHKHTRESIEFASLLQGALLPSQSIIDNYFKDDFVFWKPKDIVGGDIYLFDGLRNENECLFMVIDCTGHGVPGAFVTMIVKAVEREIIAKIKEDKTMEVSPAWVLGYFNKTIKKLLKQEDENSISNAGFDGGIVYYNKRSQILKFAGAQTPLFYIDENEELKIIKGDRYSVGYKKCIMEYEYTEHIIKVKEGMKFYITTDGYLDQNGGDKDFPFGKKRFKKIIQDNYHLPMKQQKDIFIKEIEKYENIIENNEQNDDITVVGFEIGKKSEIDVILEYEGILTQSIITHNIDIIEHSIENMNIVVKLSTLVVELTQNMMKYSKTHEIGCRDIRPAGYIKVTQIENSYKIKSKNIVSIDDKMKIENTLNEIKSMDIKEIKNRYRTLRRSGENTHEKGGGIGFYEIAKLANEIDFTFTKINEDKFYFEMKIKLQQKRK